MGALRSPINIQRPSLIPSCNRVWGETNSIKRDCDQGNFSSKIAKANLGMLQGVSKGSRSKVKGRQRG